MFYLSFFSYFRSLSSNQLSSLPRGLIDENSKLATLNLDNNPWVCDCRLNWLILWLQSTTKVRRSASSSKLPTCMEPFQYQGQRLTSIRPLKCSSNYVLQSRVFNISNMTTLNPHKLLILIHLGFRETLRIYFIKSM